MREQDAHNLALALQSLEPRAHCVALAVDRDRHAKSKIMRLTTHERASTALPPGGQRAPAKRFAMPWVFHRHGVGIKDFRDA
jgi:hypothetical protein